MTNKKTTLYSSSCHYFKLISDTVYGIGSQRSIALYGQRAVHDRLVFKLGGYIFHSGCRDNPRSFGTAGRYLWPQKNFSLWRDNFYRSLSALRVVPDTNFFNCSARNTGDWRRNDLQHRYGDAGFRLSSRRPGKILGINIAAVYIGLTIGPFIGGLLTEHLGWRYIFLFTAILGIIIILIVAAMVKEEWSGNQRRRF